MKVAKEIRKYWDETLDHGDQAKMIEEGIATGPPLGKALNKGIATEELIKAINGFCARKIKRVTENLEESKEVK